MSDLVIIEEDKACTTSLTIADGTGNEHRVVLQLISRHKKRIEHFGKISFSSAPQMRNPDNKGLGGRPVRVAMLNEAQATLVMTMMRNTPRVLDFKVALVEAFFKARDLLMTGQMGLLEVQAILYAKRDNEKGIASVCGKGLSDWKKKRDALDDAILKVERQIQPQLTNFE